MRNGGWNRNEILIVLFQALSFQVWKILEIFEKIHQSRLPYCILCMHTKFRSIRWKIDGEKFATVLDKSSTKLLFRKYYCKLFSIIFTDLDEIVYGGIESIEGGGSAIVFLIVPKIFWKFSWIGKFSIFFWKTLAELPTLVDFLYSYEDFMWFGRKFKEKSLQRHLQFYLRPRLKNKNFH